MKDSHSSLEDLVIDMNSKFTKSKYKVALAVYIGLYKLIYNGKSIINSYTVNSENGTIIIGHNTSSKLLGIKKGNVRTALSTLQTLNLITKEKHLPKGIRKEYNLYTFIHYDKLRLFSSMNNSDNIVSSKHINSKNDIITHYDIVCEVAPCEVAPCEVAPCEVAPCEVAPCEVAPCEVAPCEVAPILKQEKNNKDINNKDINNNIIKELIKNFNISDSIGVTSQNGTNIDLFKNNEQIELLKKQKTDLINKIVLMKPISNSPEDMLLFRHEKQFATDKLNKIMEMGI